MMSEIRTVKMVLLGDTVVGKTSIAYRISKQKFLTNIDNTIGASFVSKSFSDFKIGIWDTAGQERFASIAPLYYRNANIIALVYDITNPASLKRVETHLLNIHYDIINDHKFLLIGNKLDLASDENLADIDEKLRDILNRSPYIYPFDDKISMINISAKSGENFEKLIENIEYIGKEIIFAEKDEICSLPDENNMPAKNNCKC